MKTILVTILSLCSFASAQRREIVISHRDTATLETYFDEYREAARNWAVSRQRFYEPKDLTLEFRYAEAKMIWEHAKSFIGLKYLMFESGWEYGAQFDWGLGRIVHADANDFLIHLPEGMRMDWSIDLYLPR